MLERSARQAIGWAVFDQYVAPPVPRKESSTGKDSAKDSAAKETAKESDAADDPEGDGVKKNRRQADIERGWLLGQRRWCDAPGLRVTANARGASAYAQDVAQIANELDGGAKVFHLAGNAAAVEAGWRHSRLLGTYERAGEFDTLKGRVNGRNT